MDGMGCKNAEVNLRREKETTKNYIAILLCLLIPSIQIGVMSPPPPSRSPGTESGGTWASRKMTALTKQ